MKRRLLLSLAVSLLSTVGAWAQTDVTSTYLTNADFSVTTPIDNHLCGYGKDMSDKGTTYYGFQAVDGWTSVVEGADNTNASYPNSGMGAAVFAYGSTAEMKGNNKTAPATAPDGTVVGQCFGFFGVWSCGGYYYQDVTLPAGKYTLTFPIYNQSGTQANTTYTGFFPTSGTNRTVAINTTVGEWVNQTVTFTLAEETEGQIRIGYKSTGNGSGANPHIFIDCVKIEYTAAVVKDVLEAALNSANEANAILTDDDLAAAITTAQDVFNNADATQEQVNTAATALNAAIDAAYEAAMPAETGDVSFLLTNPGFEACTVTETNAAATGSAAPLNIEGGWEQTSSAAWSSSAVVEYGGAGQVNGLNAPAADNAGNAGKTLGISIGWNGTVAYRSETIKLPAGGYTLKINAYNALTDATQFKSLFGFVPTSGSGTLSTKTAFASETWETDEVSFTLTEATEGRIQIGGQASNAGSGKHAKVFFDNITISYQSPIVAAKAAYTEAKAAAEAALANEDYAAVTGDEKTALENAINAAEPTTKEGYEAAATTLNEAAAAFKAAKAAYEGLANINAVATAVGLDAAAAATSAADAIAKTQAQNVAIYNQTPKAYPYAANIGEWSKTGATKDSKGQHWNGIAESTYLEPDQWSAASVSWKLTQEKVLPAGKYILMATGRSSNDLTLEMSVLNGSEVLGSVAEFPKQDKGRGVDVNGDANFAEEGTYVNYSADDNAGRGWEWRYVPFTVASESTITLQVTATSGAKNQWASITEFRLLSAKEVNEHKLALIKAINDAQDVWDNATNVGDEVFQIPSSALNDLDDAISEAAEVRDDFEATDDEADAAKAAVEAAVEAFKNTTLNAPAEGQLFNVILTATEAGWAQENKAMTYLANDRKDQGLYNIQYKEEPNTNLAQAFTFTQVEGNNYTLSQIDADGVARYLCTGKSYGGNDNQIRTTTEVEQAMLVKIVPSATEGVYNLLNVAANNYIGSQDAGVYTVAKNINFLLVEAKKPSVTVNTTEAGWGTVMFPFAVAELPEGVKAYTCDAVEGSTLTLTEVDALEANKPYIVEGAWNATLTGDAQGTALTNTVGLLTGVYADTQAPVASYVLQNQGGNVAFYLVEDGAQPTAGANHAYLTVASGVKAFFLGEVETAIQSLQAAGEGRAIYNLSGQRVQKAQRGVYVVNGKKVVVK